MNNNQALADKLLIEGNRLWTANDIGKAEVFFRKAIIHRPDFANAHSVLGLLLYQKGMLIEAEHHYHCSIGLDPDSGKTHLNLGVLMASQKRLEEAEVEFQQALKLTPDSPDVWSNLGMLHACLKQDNEAELSYRKAITLDPAFKQAYVNLSNLLLSQGRYEEGWRLMDAQNNYTELEKNLPCPRWQGESLKGKSLLIGFEGGHGDMIQFCRYAAELKAQGAAKITLICHPPLKNLLAAMDGLDAVFAFNDTFPPSKFDFWTMMLSLPLHCQTRLDSIPAKLPYLRAERALVERWSSLLAEQQRTPGNVRVGLIWKGNPQYRNDADRSLPSLK